MAWSLPLRDNELDKQERRTYYALHTQEDIPPAHYRRSAVSVGQSDVQREQ